MTLRLSVDMMGGDRAPESVLAGAALACEKHPKLHMHLFGDMSVVEPLLRTHLTLAQRTTLHHTDEVVTNNMPPLTALRTLKRSSMRLAIEAVADGLCHAVVSAGNTGAYMALSKIILKTLDGVDRPAIATTLPTLKGPCLALDLGANIDCSVENLVQFSVMGEVLAQRILGKPKPTVALLNVGSEELKGHAVIQQAAQKLRAIKFLNFIGFAEGDDLTCGNVDVIVTDGFTGNVALKTIEGCARLIMKTAHQNFMKSWRGKLGYLIARPAFKAIQHAMDPRLHNGAAFLGLRGNAIKSHGGADAVAFANAIDVALRMMSEKQSRLIGDEIEMKLKEI